MNRARRITALVLAMVLTACVFAAAASVVIVSPAANKIVYSDSLLVSVKVPESTTVKVRVYETKEVNVNPDPADEEGIKTVTTYTTVNVKNLTDADLLLISKGKTTNTSGEAILLSDGTPVKTYSNRTYTEAESFSNKSETAIAVYTKKLEDVKPGLYRIVVETIEDEKTKSRVSSLVAVKSKEDAPQDTAINTQISAGALQKISDAIKSLFSK